MASIFLVNDNKIVSRLLQLSAQKHGYLLEEKAAPEPSRNHYDIVLVDSDKYTPELIESLKSQITFNKLGYIGVKHEEVPPEFALHLDKPFLPSDFVTLIEENTGEEAIASSETPEEQKVLSEEVNLDEGTISMELNETPEATSAATEDIDIDALLAEGSEDLGELGDLDALEDLEDLEELDLEEVSEAAPEETAPAPQASETEESGLKDLDKTEDALKELDALDEELEDIDLSLDSSAVMSTGVAEQFIEEPQPAEEAPEEETSLYEKELLAAQESAAPAEEEATATEASQTAASATEAEEEATQHSPLDHLEGFEDIEQEQDYIENELSVDTLSQEFDTLNETEVLKALNPEAENPETEHDALAVAGAAATAAAGAALVSETAPHAEQEAEEEILHEEIVSEGTETMVESNDVEQWIRDAVSKAITPEMLQEALQDMEVTIKLDFKKRDA